MIKNTGDETPLHNVSGIDISRDRSGRDDSSYQRIAMDTTELDVHGLGLPNY